MLGKHRELQVSLELIWELSVLAERTGRLVEHDVERCDSRQLHLRLKDRSRPGRAKLNMTKHHLETCRGYVCILPP
jgi:hypothetical protein